MEIRPIQPGDIESARRLIQAGGWIARDTDPERFRQLVARSQLSLVAVEKLWQRSPALVIALGVLAVAGVAWAVLRKDKPSAVAHQGAAAPEPQAN